MRALSALGAEEKLRAIERDLETRFRFCVCPPCVRVLRFDATPVPFFDKLGKVFLEFDKSQRVKLIDKKNYKNYKKQIVEIQKTM